MRRKASATLIRDRSKKNLRPLRVSKKAAAIDALMRRLKHVKSSGPYTRDEMNER